MVRKRAPGGGRKARGEAPAEHFNTRITPEVRRQLEREADRNGRTLSREIEDRLKDSLRYGPEPEDHFRPKKDKPTEAFCYLIKEAAKFAAGVQVPENQWHKNRFAFEGFR